jgi:NAD(P)-dependent dehydrogenase (short-subunit alcohol dehydrogenase family)
MTDPAAFKGKAALITGGSNGVGFRVAERLAEAGACVGRSAERGERTTVKLRQTGQDVHLIAGDCASYPDVAAVVDTTVPDSSHPTSSRDRISATARRRSHLLMRSPDRYRVRTKI